MKKRIICLLCMICLVEMAWCSLPWTGNKTLSGWDWNNSGGHLGKTEAFSTKDVLANFGFVGFLEGVYILLFCHFVLLIDKS